MYYFQIWNKKKNKKEHNIIINRVISNNSGLIYIETPCIKYLPV